jgi:hypothetical protein
MTPFPYSSNCYIFHAFRVFNVLMLVHYVKNGFRYMAINTVFAKYKNNVGNNQLVKLRSSHNFA